MSKKPRAAKARVTVDKLGLDELVMSGAFVHVERMDRGHIWMVVRSKTREVRLSFYARREPIRVVIESDTAALGREGE